MTDTRIFGVPYDRGAHWIHMPDLNPLTKLAAAPGIEVYPAPASLKVRIGRRYAREGELEDFLALQVAPIAPSPTRRARATCLRPRRCRAISATGGRRSNSCSARSAAARS